jgi:putative ABC transport system permease protein
LRKPRLMTFVRDAILPVLRVSGTNLLQHKLRLLVGLSGIAIALFLLILQIDSLDATRAKVTSLFSFFHFDLAIVPASYEILISPGTFERVRLSQARTVPQITGTEGVNIGVSSWSLPDRRTGDSILLIGLDNRPDFIRNPAVRRGLPLLADGRSILFDAYSQPDMGPVTVGQLGTLGDQRVEIAGLYRLGLFFYEPGSAIVSSSEFSRLTGRDRRDLTIGLLQTAPGADPRRVKRELEAKLPGDVRILTHDELIRQEQAYFVDTKPTGIMVDIGMVIACLVAVAIMVQVLSTEVGNRIKEYAVLKAMGFSPVFVYAIGIIQSMMLALFGVVPALLIAGAVLGYINYATHLPTGVGLGLVVLAMLVALATGVVAALSTLWRVGRADPAELF